MWGHRRTATMVTVVAAIVAVTSFVTPSGPVLACSCALEFPTVADSVGQVDIAFVGRLDSTEEIDPTEFDGSPEYFDTRYELIVEHAVKGVANGDRVVMFGDVSGGSSCGTSELERGIERYAILSSDNSGVFVADSTPPCTELPSVDALLAADLTLPAASPGPVSLVVVGRVGEAELISYGSDGRPVAYGDLPWSVGQPIVCPGSERLVQFEQDQVSRRTTLTIRDLASLAVVERVGLAELDRIEASSIDHLHDFLVQGASLDCRSADGREVAALLSWENTNTAQTTVVRFRSDGTVESIDHGRVSRATHDTSTNDAVGVAGGAFVRLGTDGESGVRTVAQLTEGPDESAFGPVFVEPDTTGGWWVGLGPEGVEGIASRLQILVHVDVDGGFERWPVRGDVEYISVVELDGDRLVGNGFSLAVPMPGSAAAGAVVDVERSDEYSYEFDLGDGRSIRPNWDDDSSRIELIANDGAATRLKHLLDVRWAVAVADGPISDPAAIDLNPTVAPVDSKWITPHAMAATDRQAPATESSNTAASTTDAHRGDADVLESTGVSRESADASATGSDETSRSAVAGVAFAVAVVLCGFAIATLRISRRRSGA